MVKLTNIQLIRLSMYLQVFLGKKNFFQNSGIILGLLKILDLRIRLPYLCQNTYKLFCEFYALYANY